MFRWQHIAGAVLGFTAGMGILALIGSDAKTAPTGRIISECDGRLEELVVQYEPSAREIVTAAYRDFLGALEPDVTVDVVCPDQPAYEDFNRMLGHVKCKLRPILTHHPITTWSRDRWVALTPVGSGHRATTIWSPRGEAADEIWPARAGDARVGYDIATALSPSVRAGRSTLYFDGGDLLTDHENVFVVSRVLPRNIQRTVQNREEFLTLAASELKRPIILLNESPDHHAGMFMASVGGRTMLVGDPSLGRKFVPADCARMDGTNEFMTLPGGPDFTPETQHLFDAVAKQCAEAGYRVVRIPDIPARDGRTYLTYVNVVMDFRDGRKIVYLPYYRGVEALNDSAREVWRALGFEIRPVDCTDTYRQFGCLHCLVNVLRRG